MKSDKRHFSFAINTRSQDRKEFYSSLLVGKNIRISDCYCTIAVSVNKAVATLLQRHLDLFL